MTTATETIMDPGIYRGMSDADYFAMPAMSHSELIRRQLGVKPPDDPEIFIVGSAVDLMVRPWLKRGDKWDGLLITDHDFRQRGAKDEYWQIVSDNPDKVVIRETKFRDAVCAYENLMSHPDIAAVVKASTPENTQVVLVWRDPETKLLCKAKCDYYGGSINDFKSTSCRGPEDFYESIWAYHYYTQELWYRWGNQVITGEDKPFNFLCGSKRGDGGGWVSQCDELHRKVARKHLRGMVNAWCDANPDHDWTIPF